MDNIFLKCEVISRKPSPDGKDKMEKKKVQERSRTEIAIDEELDNIFPPKTFVEQGENKIIVASRREVLTYEILELDDDWNKAVDKLNDDQVGFSSGLQDIYKQIFDELIRQEIIDCPERGLLMAAVRNQMRDILKYTHNLYKSTFGFSLRKDLLMQSEIMQKRKDISNFKDQLWRLSKEFETLTLQSDEERQKAEETERVESMKQNSTEEKMTLENQQLTMELENIVDKEHRWLKDVDRATESD